MTMRSTTLLILLAIAACGGGGKKEETVVDDSGGDGTSSDDTTGGDAMIPPEKMDEIQRLLDRKRLVAARCLTDAVNSGEIKNKNAKGFITVEFVISTGGKAQDVKVARTNIETDSVQQCTLSKVHEIEFPTLPASVPYSYTFAFEAN
jgi:hypothetical protein